MIAKSSLTISPWANGAGRKADIAAGEGWLLGFAWLDGDAPFSDYKGHDRTIMLVDGPGFSLTLPNGHVLTVTERNTPVAFDGAGPIACKVLGPCRVLNAMSTYPGFSHRLIVMPLTDATPGPDVFAVVLRGTVGSAGRLDTVRLTEAMTGSADALVAVACFERDE